MRTTADPKKLVKALQTGRRKLGMTDEEYRGLLSSVTGGRTTSSKELSGEELARALATLRKAGFRTTADPQIRKIKSLWYEMHDLGIVRNRSDQAIETYIRAHHAGAKNRMVLRGTAPARHRDPEKLDRQNRGTGGTGTPATLFLRTTTRHGGDAIGKRCLDLFPSYPVLVFRL